MCCSKNFRTAATLLLLVLFARGAAAEHVVGLGADFDSDDGRAFSALGSIAVANNSWLSGGASYRASRAGQTDVETVYFDGSFDHHFDPVGVRIGAAYWGDSDILDSNDLTASLYWKNDAGSLSLDYERRAFDLTFRSQSTGETRTVEFDADGVGLAARLKLGDNVSIYANGMSYDYSRDISLQPNADVVRLFASSRLSMTNSLLDRRISGGIEFDIGLRVLDFQASSWRTAVFGDQVDSIGVGLLTPINDSSDLELRLSSDNVDTFGRATLFSVFVYLYGN